ncbi:hypothetical protein D9757_012878 [Collybiopsis confluens]|uniref:F-box domain-containing protein n=1 Tax=Collybiopsis confluens TaxID=2823264 RepID=A0A8H5FWF8_9AGAR|nr:hypothetical protein D9757_012878 [Collybiopsis confluens]
MSSQMSVHQLRAAEQPSDLLTHKVVPLEIHEHIISFIRDLSALKSCSLTCGAWLQAGWRKLFEHSIVRIHRNNIDDFLQLVDRNSQSISQTIIPYIQSLHIEQGGSGRLPASNTGKHEPGDYEVFQFDDFLPRFVGLTATRSLKLGWVRNDTTVLTAIALRDNFASVTALHLDSAIMTSSQHFFDILSSFPLLSTLSLSGVMFNGGRLYDGLDDWDELDARRTDLSTTPSPPLNLSELHTNLTEDMVEFMFSWLSHHKVVFPMRKIWTGLFSASSNKALSDFLAYSGSELEEIIIRDAHTPEAFDLSACVKLCRVEVGCVYLDSSHGRTNTVAFVTDVLQTISSECTSIEIITIVLAVSNWEDMDEQVEGFDWKGLASLLKESRFKNLRRVVISVSRLEHVQRVNEAIAAYVAEEHCLDQVVFQVEAWRRSSHGMFYLS